MKKLILALLMLAMVQVQAQNTTNHPLDSLFRDVVFDQLVNDLEYDVPLMIFTPTFTAFGSFSIRNDKIYFEGDDFSPDYFKDTKNIVANDIKQFVTLNLLSKQRLNKNLNIKSFSNSNLLFTIIYKKNEEQENIDFSLPGGKYFKKQEYQDGQLVSSKVKKKNKLYLNSIKRKSNGTVNSLKYDISKRKYTLTTREMEAGKLSSKTLYKKSKKRKPDKVEEVKKYFYNSNGKIHKIVSENRKGERIDSTLYIYKNGMIASASYQRDNANSSVSYFYNKNHQLTRKEVRTPKRKLFLEYSFDMNDRLVNYKVIKPKKAYNETYSFAYNQEGDLIEIKINKNYISQNVSKTVSQYAFSYNKNGSIKTIRDIDKNGNIAKEINYEIEAMGIR